MNNYDAYIFDFDYTLADATNPIVESFNYAFDKLNLKRASYKDIVNTIRTIYNIFIKENKHVHVRIGIGEIAQGLEGLKKSYDQSRIARKTINKSGVMFYKELGIYQLLFYIDDTSKIDDYVKEILNPLLIYEDRKSVV